MALADTWILWLLFSVLAVEACARTWHRPVLPAAALCLMVISLIVGLAVYAGPWIPDEPPTAAMVQIPPGDRY